MAEAWLAAASVAGSIVSGAFGGALAYEYRLRRDRRVQDRATLDGGRSSLDAIETVCLALSSGQTTTAGLRSLRALVVGLSDDLTRLLAALPKSRRRAFQVGLLTLNGAAESIRRSNVRMKGTEAARLAQELSRMLGG